MDGCDHPDVVTRHDCVGQGEGEATVSYHRTTTVAVFTPPSSFLYHMVFIDRGLDFLFFLTFFLGGRLDSGK